MALKSGMPPVKKSTVAYVPNQPSSAVGRKDNGLQYEYLHMLDLQIEGGIEARPRGPRLLPSVMRAMW